MWKFWIMLLCATGALSAQVEPQSISIHPPPRNPTMNGENGTIRRYACPTGFIRIKRSCYYLSADTATWLEAHFRCRDINATLPTLAKKAEERHLREYLKGPQFTKLERWIGGIYDWEQMSWRWGLKGEEIKYQSFGKLKPGNPEQYKWHCIVMDPAMKYKWGARSCVQQKHYICETPAGRIRKGHWNSIDGPQNQTQRKPRKGKKYEPGKPNQAGGQQNGLVRRSWRRQWKGNRRPEQEEWAKGANLGARPPSSRRRPLNKRPNDRPRPLRSRMPKVPSDKVAQIAHQGHEYGAFSGDSSVNPQKRPQGLTDVDAESYKLQVQFNDLSQEEVLLKT